MSRRDGPSLPLVDYQGDDRIAYPQLLRAARALLPARIVKQYVLPNIIRGEQAPYNARLYFESKYRATFDTEFSNRSVISPDANPVFVRYNYNSVENGIINYLVSVGALPPARVLDIGSGAGHWIDFYLDVFGATQVTGVELSHRCATELQRKYRNQPNVDIVEDDVASPNFDAGKRFDLINAIAVMFHIIDDGAWERSLRTLARHLDQDGILVTSGQFGWITRNIEFARSDSFESWPEYAEATPAVLLAKKRIRSLRYWKAALRKCGLTIEGRRHTPHSKRIWSPENNLLFIRRTDVTRVEA